MLDTTEGDQFGADGGVATRILNAAYGRSVVIQSDGKLVVSGRAYNGSQDVIALARYDTDGNLDATFGGSNRPPVAADDSASTTEGALVDYIDVLANDSDPDGDTLDVISVTQGDHGSVGINTDDTLFYTPDPGFIGQDTFDYTISDGNGTDTATVTVTVTESQPTTFSIADVAKHEGRTGKTTSFGFVVTRSGGSLEQATIYYETAFDSGGSHPAEAGDFLSIPVTPLTFGDQVTSATIFVSVIGDLVAEYPETFLVNLFADEAGTILLETATGIILNDDKGDPVESASATDAALMALGDTGSSDNDGPDILTQTISDDLAMMMME